jgi:hypothetical protein
VEASRGVNSPFCRAVRVLLEDRWHLGGSWGILEGSAFFYLQGHEGFIHRGAVEAVEGGCEPISWHLEGSISSIEEALDCYCCVFIMYRSCHSSH